MLQVSGSQASPSQEAEQTAVPAAKKVDKQRQAMLEELKELRGLGEKAAKVPAETRFQEGIDKDPQVAYLRRKLALEEQKHKPAAEDPVGALSTLEAVEAIGDGRMTLDQARQKLQQPKPLEEARKFLAKGEEILERALGNQITAPGSEEAKKDFAMAQTCFTSALMSLQKLRTAEAKGAPPE